MIAINDIVGCGGGGGEILNTFKVAFLKGTNFSEFQNFANISCTNN